MEVRRSVWKWLMQVIWRQCFPEMSQAELLCSTSGDASLWVPEQPLVCVGMQNLHPTKRRIFLLRATFHVLNLPLCSPPAVSGVSASLWAGMWAGGCFASCQLCRQDCVMHPPRWGSGSKSASQTFSVLVFKLHHHCPCSPQCFPPPPLSCTWLFFLARLLLSVMPLTLISAPTLYLFSPSHVSLQCFVVPVPFSSPPLFLAILKNCNDIVTASPKQNEIQFACQKP